LDGPVIGLGIDARDDARASWITFLDDDWLHRARIERKREHGKDGNAD
jgi:hypothetical protein